MPLKRRKSKAFQGLNFDPCFDPYCDIISKYLGIIG